MCINKNKKKNKVGEAIRFASSRAAAAELCILQACIGLAANTTDAASGQSTPGFAPLSAADVAVAAMRQLALIARCAGAVQPGMLGLLAAEWAGVRSLVLGLAPTEERVVVTACELLAVAIRECEGALRELIEAAAQLSIELLTRGGAGSSSGSGAVRPPPACVLTPLAAAIRRAYLPGATTANAGVAGAVDADC